MSTQADLKADIPVRLPSGLFQDVLNLNKTAQTLRGDKFSYRPAKDYVIWAQDFLKSSGFGQKIDEISNKMIQEYQAERFDR